MADEQKAPVWVIENVPHLFNYDGVDYGSDEQATENVEFTDYAAYTHIARAIKAEEREAAAAEAERKAQEAAATEAAKQAESNKTGEGETVFHLKETTPSARGSLETGTGEQKNTAPPAQVSIVKAVPDEEQQQS